MLRHILLAYDGTPNSEAALALGFDLARGLNAPLHVVTVIGGSEPAKGPEFEADRRAAWQTLRASNARLLARAFRFRWTCWRETLPMRF